MKFKTLLFFVIPFLTVMFSCKNEKDIDSLEIVRPQIVDDIFKVKLNVVVKKEDNFSLYFTTDGTTNFKADPLWLNIKGSSEVQEIMFSLGKGITPSQLRLDFGMNKDQEDIVFKSIVFEYNNKKRIIEGQELGNFFRADNNKCTFDSKTGVIKANIVNGVKQFPSLYPHESNLLPELKKILN